MKSLARFGGSCEVIPADPLQIEGQRRNEDFKFPRFAGPRKIAVSIHKDPHSKPESYGKIKRRGCEMAPFIFACLSKQTACP